MEAARSTRRDAMSEGRREFGVSNLEYDLVITLANLLQGVEVMKKYQADAEQAGDNEASKLFKTLHDQNRDAAKEIHSVLADYMSGKKK
jgi:hypothetical protein